MEFENTSRASGDTSYLAFGIAALIGLAFLALRLLLVPFIGWRGALRYPWA